MIASHPKRNRLRGRGKGHSVDPVAQAAVLDAISGLPCRRDQLIEYLHRLQDRFGHVAAAHVVALADVLGLAPTEVYEVATFYHHFDVVREGERPPPPLTIRVCDSLSCEVFGADALVQALEGGLGQGVRVQRVSCVGRCDEAPVAVVGQHPVGHATLDSVSNCIEAGTTEPSVPADWIRYKKYCDAGGYTLARRCSEDGGLGDSIIQALESAGLRGLGGAGFPTGRKRCCLE